MVGTATHDSFGEIHTLWSDNVGVVVSKNTRSLSISLKDLTKYIEESFFIDFDHNLNSLGTSHTLTQVRKKVNDMHIFSPESFKFDRNFIRILSRFDMLVGWMIINIKKQRIELMISIEV